MFFEEDDKDTSRNMDDHDLDFEGEESVSWDKLLEETDAEQPKPAAVQTPDDLLTGDDQSFDDLIGEQPLNIDEGARKEYSQGLGAAAPADEYSFDLGIDEAVAAQSFVPEPNFEEPEFEENYDIPSDQTVSNEAVSQYFGSQDPELQTAPTYQAPAPDEEYDTQGYDYEEEELIPGSQEPQAPPPERGIPGGSLAEDSPAPKKSNMGLLAVAAALLVVVVLGGLGYVGYTNYLAPMIENASTGDADDLLNTETQIEQQDINTDNAAALQTDDPVGPPPDGGEAPAPAPPPDTPAQPAPADSGTQTGGGAQAPEQPGVSKKVEDKGKAAAKDPKAAKAEPGRGKVLLPVVNTGRANPFTPLVPYNSLGFIAKPNMAIPEPPTSLGDLAIGEALEKLQKITVSGILYDSVKPSAIIKVSGVDYFVQKGDKVDSYIVADITKTTVIIKEGGSSYRASIGEAFSSNEALKGQISAGAAAQRQYVSAKDVGVAVSPPVNY